LLPGGDTILRQAAYAFVPFILFNHVALAMVAIDQGAGWFGRMNWTRLIVNPVYLLFVVGLWLAGIRNVVWFVISLVVANGVVAFARIALAIRQGPLLGPMEPIKRVFREAVPFGLAGLLNPLAQSADKALLLYLLGTTQLGFYAVALTAASVVNSLAGAAGTVSFGMSTQAKDREGSTALHVCSEITSRVLLRVSASRSSFHSCCRYYMGPRFGRRSGQPSS
jgi:O-antigen/teichoic acid export membrane protein